MARNRPRKKKGWTRLVDDVRRRTPKKRTTVAISGGSKTSEEISLSIRTKPICWGIPMDEVMYSKFFVNFLRLNRMPWDADATTESTYLPAARNHIHNSFLEIDVSHLMMLDSDIVAPPHLLETLLAHDLPIVGGWYRNKKAASGFHPVVYDFSHEDENGYQFRHRNEKGEGVERVDGMGAGCWLMRRDVAEALGENPYSMHKATEDLNLCYQLMKLEIPLHVDWSLACAHVGVGFV